MSGHSEEKQFAASQKKLRDSRRKGRVSQSRDFASSFNFLGVITYLYLNYQDVYKEIIEITEMVSDPYGSFYDKVTRSLYQSSLVIFSVIGPVAVIALVVSVFFGVISTSGPVFSFETIKPQFDHISPSKGLGRIFALRNAIEFCKGLVKVIFFVCLFAIILSMWMKPLFLAPSCGETCIGPIVKSMLVPFGIAAALGFIVIGLIDLPLQRWLFSRDMRMTKSELKREHKDAEGDPLLQQRLKGQRREIVSQSGKRGIAAANLSFTWKGKLVALQYIDGQMDVPIVVEKTEGLEMANKLAFLKERGIAIIENEVADVVYRKARIGDPIPKESFASIGRYLFELGIAR